MYIYICYIHVLHTLSNINIHLTCGPTQGQSPEIPRGVQLRALFVATNAFAHPETTAALLQPVPLAFCFESHCFLNNAHLFLYHTLAFSLLSLSRSASFLSLFLSFSVSLRAL